MMRSRCCGVEMDTRCRVLPALHWSTRVSRLPLSVRSDVPWRWSGRLVSSGLCLPVLLRVSSVPRLAVPPLHRLWPSTRLFCVGLCM
ncbi:unnamed protein product [Mycena citricolor]|uniref:Uncharacterized protein n=1 Tax=Mycena citricolor TaxID=2018698 RepID=A0AAD2JX37_9AGAR|nr:unnamed protein product [Mycena citricolor]